MVEPLHIFLTVDACRGKSFLMKVMYQSLTKNFFMDTCQQINISSILLYYIHLRLNEISETDTESFVGLTILAVGDFFQLPPVERRSVYAKHKKPWQHSNSFWKQLKMFE